MSTAARAFTPKNQYRRWSGYVIVCIITLACLLLATLLSPGTPVNPEPLARLRYIRDTTLVWQLAWLAWTASALALAIFCTLLLVYLPQRPARYVALGLVYLGVLPDLAAHTVLIAVLPNLLEQPDRFVQFESLAHILTGAVANTFYCLGGLFLNVLLRDNPRLPRALVIAGIPAWLFGLALSLAVILDQFSYAALFTAIAMIWSVSWMFMFSHIVLRQSPRYEIAPYA